MEEGIHSAAGEDYAFYDAKSHAVCRGGVGPHVGNAADRGVAQQSREPTPASIAQLPQPAGPGRKSVPRESGGIGA